MIELTEQEYDDSPWTRDELEALAWVLIENGGEDFDEYDLPCSPKPEAQR